MGGFESDGVIHAHVCMREDETDNTHLTYLWCLRECVFQAKAKVVQTARVERDELSVAVA